ncbi:MAG: CHASE2 domain-containing protein [Comamonadaceae bacterium]|nr:CHASE2 domain-containing protein [Comamonadaceae bacterium]
MRPRRASASSAFDWTRDGVLRRAHLAHGLRQTAAQPAACRSLERALGASSVRYAEGMLHAGSASWPVAANGEVLLRYPANQGELRVIPFYEAVLAAAGAEQYQVLAGDLRGKTVFVGSTSITLADYVLTPRGRLSGLHLAALAHQMLLHGHVIRPAWWLWDALLLAAGLLPGIIGMAPAGVLPIRRRLGALLLTVTLTVSGGIASALPRLGRRHGSLRSPPASSLKPSCWRFRCMPFSAKGSASTTRNWPRRRLAA